MADLMYRATTKEAWDSFAASIIELDPYVAIDEIGSINEDERYHVNVRTNIADTTELQNGATNVEWIDPSIVATPYRVWL